MPVSLFTNRETSMLSSSPLIPGVQSRMAEHSLSSISSPGLLRWNSKPLWKWWNLRMNGKIWYFSGRIVNFGENFCGKQMWAAENFACGESWHKSSMCTMSTMCNVQNVHSPFSEYGIYPCPHRHCSLLGPRASLFRGVWLAEGLTFSQYDERT